MKKINSRFTEINLLDEDNVIVDDFTYNRKFINLEFNDQYNTMNFDHCVFEKCTFMNLVTKVSFHNCYFVECEFSNMSFEDSKFDKCLLEKNRMVGFNIYDSSMTNTDLLDNNLKYSNFNENNMLGVILKNNNFEQSFFDKIIFRDPILEDNNFTEAEIIGTNLNGIDFRGNKIDRIKLEIKYIPGMIVSYDQAIDLIGVLGIEIK